MILAIDPGLPNCGWSLVNDSGSVAALGLCHAPEPKEFPANVAKPWQTYRVARELIAVMHYSLANWLPVRTIVVEEVGLFGQQPAIVANTFPWGAITMLAAFYEPLELRKVSPLKWQRRIQAKGKIDYRLVRDALSRHVAEAETVTPIARSQLRAIAANKRTHALDAVGIGIYAALGYPTVRIAP